MAKTLKTGLKKAWVTDRGIAGISSQMAFRTEERRRNLVRRRKCIAASCLSAFLSHLHNKAGKSFLCEDVEILESEYLFSPLG
jgi:hypothetical protein